MPILRKTKEVPDLELFRKQLKARDLKATPQRLAVHGAMMKLVHASADMVCERMTADGHADKVTTASVYNILSQLADAGIYTRRLSTNNKMYFDVLSYPHAHLYDARNHVHYDLIDDELRTLLEKHFKGRRFRGFHIEGFDVQVMCRPTRKYKKSF